MQPRRSQERLRRHKRDDSETSWHTGQKKGADAEETERDSARKTDRIGTTAMMIGLSGTKQAALFVLPGIRRKL